MFAVKKTFGLTARCRAGVSRPQGGNDANSQRAKPAQCHRHGSAAQLTGRYPNVDCSYTGRCGSIAYTSVEKCSEHKGHQAVWQVAALRTTYRKYGKRRALYKTIRKIQKAKAQVRAKVEHLFGVIKWQFGYTKVCFRRLVKNTAQLVMLFDLSNLRMFRPAGIC